MIEIELPGGTIIEFPDGTPPEVMQSMAARYASTMQHNRDFEEGLQADKDAQRGIVDKAADLAREYVQGATLGYGDEIVAGLAGVMLPGDTGENYGKVLEQERAARDNFKRLNPTLATGAEITGAVLSPANALLGGGGVARGVATGAAGGSAYGFGAGEGFDDRLLGAGEGGVLGGLVGGALPMLAAPFRGKAESARKFIKNNPVDLDDMARGAGDVFEANKGAPISAESVQKRAPGLYARLLDKGLDPVNNPKVQRAYQRVDDLTQSPDPLTVNSLSQVRKTAQGVRDAVTEPKHDRKLAGMIMDEIDDIVADNDPALASAIKKARQTWGRMRRTEQIDAAIKAAEDTASGYENGLRIEFRKILKSPKKRAGFAPAEIEAMERVSRGTPMQNILRQVGRFGFNLTGKNFTNTLAPMAGAAGGAAINPVLGALVPAAGTAAQVASHRLADRNAQLIRAMVASGRAPAEATGRLSQLLANPATDVLPLAMQPVNPLQDRLLRR